ncbi:hypothetical protein [Cytobacillus citreus]|uniref:hypothetical protein n=1 Tax=Cytobacillus citreus TaxID=2833586 RepID=UPI0020175246|nr:hypothetical protein [Cytobacillus citreus]
MIKTSTIDSRVLMRDSGELIKNCGSKMAVDAPRIIWIMLGTWTGRSSPFAIPCSITAVTVPHSS